MCRRSHWPPSRPSSGRAWPRGRSNWEIRGKARPGTGRNLLVPWTSTSCWRCSRRTPRAWRALCCWPATPCAICPASSSSGNRTCRRHRTTASRSASRTASASRRSRAPASPAPTRARRRSRRASSSWDTRTRPAACHPCRSRRCWAATAPTWPFASCTRGWPPSASTCTIAPPTAPRSAGWRPSSSGAGPVAPRWRWLRTGMTPSSAPTPSATTPSCTATTRVA